MKPHVTVALVCVVCLAFTGCERTEYVTEEMTWKCVPEEYNLAYYAKPDEYVRFWFVRDPHCEELESSKNFCTEMSRANKAVVKVEFALWGTGRKLHGYHMLSVDGRPIQHIGGWGSSGAKGQSGPCPLDEAFAR